MSIVYGVPFRELEYHYNGIACENVWDQDKAIDMRECLICGSGQLERFYCTENNATISEVSLGLTYFNRHTA